MSPSKTAPPPAPPPPRAGNGATRKPVETVSRKLTVRQPQKLPPRIVVNAVEGWGKTTLGAYAPSPVILMARGETGYDTLLSATPPLVPAVPAEPIESWTELLGWLDTLAVDPQGRETVVLDALGGFERLCHEHVCDTEFKGDWGERGFAAFQKGYDLSVGEWLKLLARLDRLHDNDMAIIMLGHAKIAPFKNPLGPDHDRYICDVHHKTWAPTNRWADAVLFGNFYTVMEDEAKAERSGKGKAIGGTDRVLYTEHRDAYVAKNRYRMPAEIWLEGGPAGSWKSIAQHITNESEVTS